MDKKSLTSPSYFSWMAAANKYALKLVITSFEFLIAFIILGRGAQKESIKNILWWILMLSFVPLYVIMFTLIDSLQFTMRIKTIFGLLCALFFTAAALVYFYNGTSDSDYMIYVSSKIFLWK